MTNELYLKLTFFNQSEASDATNLTSGLPEVYIWVNQSEAGVFSQTVQKIDGDLRESKRLRYRVYQVK